MAIDYSVFAGLSCAQPKGPSRLDQVEADDKAKQKADAAFRKAVWKRDEGRCRACGKRVERSLALMPTRGEVHHIAKRSKEPGLLTDPRNGVLLCARDHERVERHQLVIVATGASTFTVGSGVFINAEGALRFVESKK